MNIVRRIVVATAGVVVVALVLALAEPKAVHAVVSALVTVSNGPGNPVPTVAVDTRNVNVVNTPNVNVAGLPAVQLSGTPSVNIANPLSIGGNVNATVSNPTDGNGNPVPLVTQGSLSKANVFDVFGECTYNINGGCALNLYNVPMGKIAVIQSASWECEIPSGDIVPFPSIRFWSPANQVVISSMQPGPSIQLGGTTNGLPSASASGQERLTAYAVEGTSPGDNGITLSLTAVGSVFPTGFVCEGELAGYLISQ